MRAQRSVLILNTGAPRSRFPDAAHSFFRWGKTVIHCPRCHGYGFSRQRLGVLYGGLASGHQSNLVPEWGPTTLFLNGGAIDPDTAIALQRRGVVIEPGQIDSLVGEGTGLSAVRLRDGTMRPMDALHVGPTTRLNSDLPGKLGCADEQGLMGATVMVDEMKATSAAGVFAAGDITRAGHTNFAVADGVMAALAIHLALAFGT